jgi:uncharacterized protein YndB with AHSA1/START domain
MQTTTDAITRELEIAATPETVWEFLVDPEKAVRWRRSARRNIPWPHAGTDPWIR